MNNGIGFSTPVRAQFIRSPHSEQIAAGLNAAGAECCKHDRSPCILRCGVRRTLGRWEPIPLWRRLEWLGNIERGRR